MGQDRHKQLSRGLQRQFHLQIQQIHQVAGCFMISRIDFQQLTVANPCKTADMLLYPGMAYQEKHAIGEKCSKLINTHGSLRLTCRVQATSSRAVSTLMCQEGGRRRLTTALQDSCVSNHTHAQFRQCLCTVGVCNHSVIACSSFTSLPLISLYSMA